MGIDHHDKITKLCLSQFFGIQPKELYHFTGVESGKNIESSRTFFAFEIWSMKDLAEFNHALDLFFKRIQLRRKRTKWGRKDRKIVNDFEKLKLFFENEKKDPAMRYFIISFTKDNKNFYLKRHYGEKRISVSPQALFPREAVNGTSLMGASVIYSETKKAIMIDYLIDHYLASVKQVSGLAAGLNEDEILDENSVVNQSLRLLFLGVFQTLVIYGIFFKRKRPYQKEKEFRFVVMTSHYEKMKILNSNTRERNYIEIGY
jgi:hypothetical protein